MELSDKTKRFLKNNKEVIERNDFYTLYYNLYYTKKPLIIKEVTNLFESLNMDLINYVDYKVGGRVRILDINYRYRYYSDFFKENNLPKEWENLYLKGENINYLRGDAGKIIFKIKSKELQTPVYVVKYEENILSPTPSKETFIFLFPTFDIKKI